MLSKARYVVSIAIVCGLLASFSVYRYLLRYDAMVEAKEIVTESVVIVTRDLPPGTEITLDDVRVADWPIELVPAQVFHDPALVAGRVTRQPLVAGEAVIESRLAALGAEQGLAATIPAGFRAMTVAVNMVSGVSGFVLPGSRVDVLVSIRPPGKREAVAKTILQNVYVLAVDQETEGHDGRPKTSRAVTLMVEPAEAEKLGLGATEGTLLLSLRSRTDNTTAATSGITVAKLMGPEPRPPRKKVAEPLPPPTANPTRVDVIRGTQRSTEELND